MGEALYRSEPVARALLDRFDELIRQEREISLLDVIFDRSDAGDDTGDPARAMLAVYALQCALTAQLASAGIRPGAVFGHGPGALAAAQAAGVFSPEDGLRIALALGELQGSSRKDAQPSLDGLESALADNALSAPYVPLVSNLTGQAIESVNELDCGYWLGQAREPADFAGCAKTLMSLAMDVVVEIGPDKTFGRRIIDAWQDPAGSPLLLPNPVSPIGNGATAEPGDWFARTVAGAYEAGLDISFAGLFAGEVRRRVSLPGYPFQRRRHWV